MEKKLLLPSFSNQIALDIGLKIVQLAKQKKWVIGIEVCRLNHTVFLYLDDGTSADNLNWIRRKVNVVKHFELSSMAVKCNLEKDQTTLSETFALNHEDHVACGGSIPIFTIDAGMVGIITVTGMTDAEDHQLIVDALASEYEFAQ